jgi:hypothetical protein
MVLAPFKTVQQILPLNQVKFLKELDKSSEKELTYLLENLEKQLQEIPTRSKVPIDKAIIHAHYFMGGSDWYVIEWDRKDNMFFGFAVLNGDLQNAELGYFTFAELDEFNQYPRLMQLDFNWNKINFRSLQVLLEIVEPEDEFKTDRINNLIADQHFKQYPSDILGEETQKKRGDRGENEYETIVKGTLKEALAMIDVPVIEPYVEEDSSIAIAKAKAKAIALALDLDMEL